MTAVLLGALLTTVPVAALGAEAATSAATRAPIRAARASLAVRADRAAGWIGEAVPVTVTAVFRDVEGVTLEGLPVLTSKAVITSQISKEPVQSTEIVGGERVLVARWTATVTPSTSGPLDLAVTLPVRLRYRDAAPRIVRPAAPVDPFGDSDGDDDPFAMFNRMRARMMQGMDEVSVGQTHEEATALKAVAKPFEVRGLPNAGQPADFSGAVGTFDINATLSGAKASVSVPITLRIAVSGDLDPDRVDVLGIPSSSEWKAYPPRVTSAPAPPGAKMTKKVFEQVLVPLQGGMATVPPVSFTAFDPASGTYITHETTPLDVLVEGSGSVIVPPPIAAAPPVVRLAPSPVWTETRQRYAVYAVVIAGSAALLFGIAIAAASSLRRRRPRWALRRSMRRAAAEGNVESFLGTAHRFIAARLAERWGVNPTEVTVASIRERLGPDGGALADVLAADAALRFGRRGIEAVELGPLCRSVERSLRAPAMAMS